MSKTAERMFSAADERGRCVLGTWGVVLGLVMAAASWTLACKVAWGHGADGGSQSRRPPAEKKPAASQAVPLKLDERPLEPRHGGQATATKWHYFEVVYGPQETRIYVYSPSQRQLAAKYATGEVLMQVQSSGQEARYPVSHVPEMGGYLCVSTDLSRVSDGDMLVTFDLANLPFREEPSVRFTQTFCLPQSVATATAGAAAVRVACHREELRRLPPVVPEMAQTPQPRGMPDDCCHEGRE